jgi:hypothetical protein
MDNYRIVLYLSDSTFELPVLPEKISVKRSLDSSEKTVLELGNVNILRGAKLRQISFSSFFPAQKIPAVSVRTKIKEPLWYVQKLRDMMESRKALRFVLLGDDLDINTQMSVESFEYSESYGAVGDIEYKLTLKEWVDYSPRKVTIKQNKAVSESKTRSGQPETAPEDSAVQYTVKSGDCLWSICKAQYNDGSLYDKLYQANKSVMDARNKGTGNPSYTIYVGEVLTLPPKEEL